MATFEQMLAQAEAEQAAPQEATFEELLTQAEAEESQTAEQVGIDYERMFKKGADQNVASFGASAGAEVARLGDNLMDMVGAMTPERVTERDFARQQQLSANPNVDMDSGYATAGQIGADVMAAIPTAVLATKLGTAAIPAVALRFLPQAGSKLAGLGTALFEGGVVGATQSEAGNRGINATQAGGTNAVLNTALRALSRGGIRGIGNESKEAKKLLDETEFITGERPFLPMLQSIDPKSAGTGDTIAGIIGNVSAVLPKAQAQLRQQADKAYQQITKGILKTRFKGADKGATVSRVLDETGDVGKAIDASRKTLRKGIKTPYTSPEQMAIAEAAKRAPQGKFTPDQLATQSRRVKDEVDKFSGRYEVGGAPLEDTITSLRATVGQPIGITDLSTRTFFQDLGSIVGKMVGAVPVLSGLASTTATKGFQNFIMGNAGAQKILQELMKKGDDAGVIEALKGFVKAYSADATNDQAIDQTDGILTQSLTAAQNVKNRVI